MGLDDPDKFYGGTCMPPKLEFSPGHLREDGSRRVSFRHDPTVTPGNVEELWPVWGKPPIHWYPCGHTTMLFYRQQVGEDLAWFVAGWSKR